MLTIRTAECPVCGVEPIIQEVTQLALLIHGGYGADSRKTFCICDCDVRIVSVESINPRTVPPAE